MPKLSTDLFKELKIDVDWKYIFNSFIYYRVYERYEGTTGPIFGLVIQEAGSQS